METVGAPQVLLRQIAELTAEGLEPEQIRSRTDLDVSFIRRVQALEEFEVELERISPEAAQLWREAKASSHAKRRVKLAAREDAPAHYQMLRDLVRTSNSMRDTEKANFLIQMIKFSGAVDEHVEEETVHMAPSQLALIQQALEELKH